MHPTALTQKREGEGEQWRDWSLLKVRFTVHDSWPNRLGLRLIGNLRHHRTALWESVVSIVFVGYKIHETGKTITISPVGSYHR